MVPQTQEGHIVNLVLTACLFLAVVLACIEVLYSNVLVSMLHTKPITFSLWFLDFSDCFKLTFFVAVYSGISCTISTLFLRNFVRLKPPAGNDPLNLEIRSTAV